MTLAQRPAVGAAVEREFCFSQLFPSGFDADQPNGLQRRSFNLGEGLVGILDNFRHYDSCCCFVRYSPEEPKTLRLVFDHPGKLRSCVAGGWTLEPEEPTLDAYWVPCLPTLRRLGHQGHVTEERSAEILGLEGSSVGLCFSIHAQAGWALDFVVWRIPASARRLLTELRTLSAPEGKPWFLWGSHTNYDSPADVYLHQIFGAVFENRYAWPFGRKICSENDAHSLYVTLAGLERATMKAIYGLLRAQLLCSVLARQGADGGWRHGEWTEDMESHIRLHCSAMHLLMDAVAEKEDPTVREALKKAAAFLSRQVDQLKVGQWFLHDELEHNPQSLRKGPFKWVKNRTLGKAESNMLVLNTQLDATIALDRYREITGDTRFTGLVEGARAATRAVLGLRPAQWLYTPLFRLVALTFLPVAEAKRLPVWIRALKRITWKYLIPLLPLIKARFPRLVMPGGYVDRELCLRGWAHDYHSVNLMDLARYHRRFPEDGLKAVLRDGLGFARKSGILARWKEMDYHRYALGFWAEALYHVCMLDPGAHYRAWLVEAILDLEELGMGLPPSLLGANAEAIPPSRQVPCPVPRDACLRVVNLSCRDKVEVLVVNVGVKAAPPHWDRPPVQELVWGDQEGKPLHGTPAVVPARGWLWGRSASLVTGS